MHQLLPTHDGRESIRCFLPKSLIREIQMDFHLNNLPWNWWEGLADKSSLSRAAFACQCHLSQEKYIYSQKETTHKREREDEWPAPDALLPQTPWWLAIHDCLGKVTAADAIRRWLTCPVMPTESALKPKNGCVNEVALVVADWAGWPRWVLVWCASQKAGETRKVKYGSVIRSDVGWDDQGGTDVTCVSWIGPGALAYVIRVE